MDFGFDADQEALRALAHKALAGACGAAPAAVWDELARAGLLGLGLPADHGGAGLGVVEQCLLFVEAGRAAAPPSLVTAAVAAATLGRYAPPAQAARGLDGVATGTAIVTAALHEAGGDPARPSTRAEADGRGWRLYGVKLAVPAVELRAPALAIVPARLPNGATGLFLVACDAPGVRREAATITDDTTVHQLTFDGVRLDEDAVLAAGAGDAALAWLLAHLTAGLAAFALGIAERQLQMTAEHVIRRQQFGKPIGSFQAVAQRCADMHVDVESLRLATWQAAFHLGRADADADADAATRDAAVATAGWWAAEAGARIAAAAQHLHAGIGFDRNYPLYRYFLAAKRIELELGGANRQLARLGRVLTREARP